MNTERIGKCLWFNLGINVGTAEIEEMDGRVDLRISRGIDDEVVSLDTDHAESMLRAMLREIAGPSIDDVREVWGDSFLAVSWLEGYCAVVDVDGYVVGGDDHETEREALQAAYDAGVERKGAAP